MNFPSFVWILVSVVFIVWMATRMPVDPGAGGIGIQPLPVSQQQDTPISATPAIPAATEAQPQNLMAPAETVSPDNAGSADGTESAENQAVPATETAPAPQN